jgi:hypothetical protein
MARTGPDIDTDRLRRALWVSYALRVERLTFLPVGFASLCYAVECADGTRRFLRLSDGGGFVPFTASDPEFYLPLTHQLHTCGILPNVPHPARTLDGRFQTRFDGWRLVLFNYIEGTVVGLDGLHGGVLQELARLVGVLHKSRSLIDLSNPVVERFDIAFEGPLLSGLDALAELGGSERRGKRVLRDLLLPHRSEVLALLARLREYQSLARGRGKPMVICHTDLHGENLMVDRRGALHILDWEGAMLAPPEHDLCFFAGDDRFWDIFLPSYEAEFGRVDIDIDVVGFYLYRRNLEDLADYVVRILRGSDEARDDADLTGISEDCIRGWSDLEPTIERISSHLGRWGRR